MEFCQIELNYFDYRFQNAKGKVRLLEEWNIPVWVMEPVRGGQLAELTPDAEARMREARPDEDIPAWAFRFLQTIPAVLTLSGMSSLEQMKENFATYQEKKPLNREEVKALLDIAGRMVKKIVLPCTACRYCTIHCP